MNVLSLFSGIGGFDLGFERAGMTMLAQVEINKHCQELLRRRFPHAELHSDVREINGHDFKAVDLVCGGFPCQDLSVAGKRKGLAGERSGLWFEFHRILTEARPAWVVIENVPGLLSSHGGKDFAVLLRGLVECGFGVCWRVLDAQYFGVAQRRRRVFIVGHLGDGRAAEVLFERESTAGNSPPSREEGAELAKDVAASLRSGGKGERGWIGDNEQGLAIAFQQNTRDEVRLMGGNGDIAGALPAQPGMKQQNYLAFSAGQSSKSYGIAADENVTPPIRGVGSGTNQVPSIVISRDAVPKTAGGKVTDLRAGNPHPSVVAISPPLRCEGHDASEDGRGRRALVVAPLSASGAGTSRTGNERTEADMLVTPLYYSHDYNQDRIYSPDGIAPAHNANDSNRARNVLSLGGVRRLTPTECERLQGFPDGWTEGFADSVRYRMLGNAVCVPVAEWIGRRIMTDWS